MQRVAGQVDSDVGERGHVHAAAKVPLQFLPRAGAVQVREHQVVAELRRVAGARALEFIAENGVRLAAQRDGSRLQVVAAIRLTIETRGIRRGGRIQYDQGIDIGVGDCPLRRIKCSCRESVDKQRLRGAIEPTRVARNRHGRVLTRCDMVHSPAVADHDVVLDPRGSSNDHVTAGAAED